MDDNRFEKRMELLNKSYKNIPYHSNSADIIQVIKRAQTPPKKRILFHWSYVASFIGVFLISAVLILQMTMGGHGKEMGNQTGGDGGIIEQIRGEINDAQDLYELRKTQAMEQLGLTEPLFRSTEMSRDSKRYMTYIESIPKRDISNERKLEWLQRAKGELNQILTTPDVMMKSLIAPLTKEEAQAWVEEFVQKEDDVLRIYEEVLNEHKEYWEPYIKDGQINMKEFNQRKSDDPQMVSMIRNGIFNNAIRLSYNSEKEKVETSFDVEYFNMVSTSEALPVEYELYMKTRFDPVIQAGQFTGTWKEAADRLMDYEKMLTILPDSSQLREEVKRKYDLLYQSFVGKNVYQPIFDEKNELTPIVEETYQYILKEYPENTTSHHLKEVYEEVEESHFIKPDRWVQPTPVILSSQTEDIYERSR